MEWHVRSEWRTASDVFMWHTHPNHAVTFHTSFKPNNPGLRWALMVLELCCGTDQIWPEVRTWPWVSILDGFYYQNVPLLWQE